MIPVVHIVLDRRTLPTTLLQTSDRLKFLNGSRERCGDSTGDHGNNRITEKFRTLGCKYYGERHSRYQAAHPTNLVILVGKKIDQ
jgi:hypothetical protein